MTSLQSQFAVDLFLCFRLLESEVPTVNKPRGACLYFNSHQREKIVFSAPFSHANGNQLGDEMKKNMVSCTQDTGDPSGLDLYIDTAWKVELAQRVHRTGRRSVDVKQTLVGTQLKLLTGFLVNVR